MMTDVMPSLAQPLQHTQHVVALLPAQAGQRLVEQQQSRDARQGARQLHQPKLLVGELAGGHARPDLPTRPMQRPRGRGDGVAASDEAGAVGSDDHVVEHAAGEESCAPPGRCGRRPCGRPRWIFRPSIGSPASVAVPSSAGSTPFSTLNSVVLPAPFGPMMPRISPSATAKLTSLTALRPPKTRDRFSTFSSARARRARTAGVTGGDARRDREIGSGQPSGRKKRSRIVQNNPSGDGQHDGDDGDAVHHALDAGQDSAQLGVQ